VVFITTDARRINLFSRRIQEVPQGAGSGFIWDDHGIIVTNFHVIENASASHVILYDQTTCDAAVLGADPEHDLAVLTITPPPGASLVPIPVGASSDLLVGQTVLAIGNPYGFDQTLTEGIISALNRTIIGVAKNPIDGVIQTDAAINPGNSGGPLLDSAGRLIGMNTAIVSPSGNWSGIGFAIPVDTINRIVPQIIQSGRVSRAKLGVQYDDNELTRRLLRRDGIEGLAITDVVPDSPAAKAGLIGLSIGRRGLPDLGDVITALNDRPIKSPSDLYSAMDRVKPGETVEVTAWRNGQTRRMRITAGE
jgi:S1-C subfamily serine protease